MVLRGMQGAIEPAGQTRAVEVVVGTGPVRWESPLAWTSRNYVLLVCHRLERERWSFEIEV
jgi:hypothetical protein